MKSVKLFNIERVERKFSFWLVANRRRLLFMFAFLVILFVLKDNFGLNVYWDTKTIFIATAALGIFLLKFETNVVFIAAIPLLVVTLFLLLIQHLSFAEFVGDNIYLFILAITLKELVVGKLMKEKKNVV